ncbi:putative Organic cation transporter protein-like 28, partial [Homarus americanus]
TMRHRLLTHCLSGIGLAQNNAIRVIVKAPTWTKIENLHMETGFTSLQTRAERLTACFATKLITRARESDVKNGLLRAVNLNRDVFNKKTRLLCAADADTVNGVGVESPDVIAANWKKKVKEESVDVRNSKQDSRNDSNAMIESLEDLQELAGTSGRWNLTVIVLACLCTFVSPFQAISYQFLGATPNYWCHVVPLVDANWTNEEILDFAIPSSSCRRKFVFIDSKVSVTALEWKTNSLPICACRGIEFYD